MRGGYYGDREYDMYLESGGTADPFTPPQKAKAMALTPRQKVRKLEAELIAIDGFYKTADDMEPDLRGKPVQIWLEGETIKAATLG